MRKLIFFDIDGTLIGSQGQILAESTKDAIRRAQANGHVCVVNTGRTWRLVRDWLPGQASFNGYLLGCGTTARFQDKVLWHNTFSKEQGRRIIDALDQCRIDALFEGDGENCTKKLTEFHTDFFRRYMEIRYHREYRSLDEVSFDKLFLYADNTERFDVFRQEFQQELTFIDRENGFWEVVPAGFSKGQGMEQLAKTLEIPMADTVAIGDSNNDLEMLHCAGISIAMGNAIASIQDMADYVTTDVMENGIWNALSWLKVL